MVTNKPKNIHNRMAANHRYGTRTGDGVSRGFNGHPARASYNYAAGEYNRLPGELRGKVV